MEVVEMEGNVYRTAWISKRWRKKKPEVSRAFLHWLLGVTGATILIQTAGLMWESLPQLNETSIPKCRKPYTLVGIQTAGGWHVSRLL